MESGVRAMRMAAAMSMLIGALWVGASAMAAAEPAAPAPAVTAIRAARLVSDGAVLASQVVLVTGNRISAVGAASKVSM